MTKAEFSAPITPVFSVTRSFRNHSNMLIWSLKNFVTIIVKTLVLLNIFVETVMLFSGFFYQYKVQKKIIYSQQKHKYNTEVMAAENSALPSRE